MTEQEKINSKKPKTETSTKSKIQFKPLHEGMGFHPFSDGLPYAPESKNKYSSGTGAVSAGRPQFVAQKLSSSSSLGNSKPLGTARQLQGQAQGQLQGQNSLATPRINQPLPAAQRLQKTPPQIAAAVHPELMSDTGLLRRRFFAYLMDTIIHAGFWLAANLTALFFFKFQIDSEIIRDNFLQFFLFFLTSQWMFIALQEMLFENSIGKVFFNLEFKRNHRSLLLRSVVFIAGVLFFGLGLFFRPQDRLGEIQLKSKIYAS